MGMMDAATRAKFLLAVHKHTLQAFDAGGTVLPGPGQAATSNPGGLLGGVGSVLGTNATAAPVQQGTNVGQLNNAYTGAQGAIDQTKGLVSTLNGQGQQGAAAQTALGGQLTNEAAGLGPNPAQAALNQSTGQNIAAQAALMAGQRGASANPALIARQAAMQGAATQQQAVGQGATLQAQQQLAAQQQLQNLSATQIGQNTGAVGALNQEQQGEQGILQSANTAANNATVASQSNINDNNQKSGSSLLGGIGSGLSALAGFIGLAEGGEVGPKSSAAQWLKSDAKPMAQGGEIKTYLAATGGKVKASAPKQKATKKDNSYDNDKVPAMLSEGEIVIPRSITQHPMAPEMSARFVQAALNKRKMGARA